MDIYDIIETICETELKGKELLIQSFLLGIAWGRKQINNLNELKRAVITLVKIENLINTNQTSPFSKDDQFNKYVQNTNFHIFALPEGKIIMEEDEKKQTKKDSNIQSLECQVCQFRINKNNFEYGILDCKHQFHLKCLYVEVAKFGKCCPKCRMEIPQDKIKALYDQLPDDYKSVCPRLECEKTFIYYGQESFDCNKCGSLWCLKCQKPVDGQHECIPDFDSYPLKLGDKFKYCQICKKSFMIKHTGNMTCNCEKGQRSFAGKIFNLIKAPFRKPL